ncbi:MAG TPA: tetratricopeptide repeat protein, partial [Ktedonobacteraceae bacterium]|nr:tetratricopeptide repeat protein [Ktedonobacteraceae bacterium]
CKGVACWIRGNYDEALAALQQSIAEKPNQEDAHFWQGMAYASLGRDEEARAAIERALQTPFPPLLLAPLRWFEQDRPDFYTAYVAPLLQEKL